MVNTVKLGSINFPKLMRQVGYRTNQVRDLVFARDAIFQKTVGNKKDADGSSGDGTGRSDAMAGPDVSFGYEGRLSTALPGTAANTAYHVSSPELILPGLKALQTPIMSRSGNLERTGHRITGACTFYMPSMGYIKALDNFSETAQFDELETFDKLIDMERIIIPALSGEQFTTALGGTHYYSTVGGWRGNGYRIAGGTQTGVANASTRITFDGGDGEWPATEHYSPAYEIDRIQFQIKSSGILDYVLLKGNTGGDDVDLKWDGNLQLSSTEWTTVDLPIRDIAVGDTTLVFKGGTGNTFTAAYTEDAIADFDKMVGGDSSNYIDHVQIQLTGSVVHEVRNLKLYKESEWRVESIKDYRDEYMEVAAVRVRGDRTSRRRAHG